MKSKLMLLLLTPLFALPAVLSSSASTENSAADVFNVDAVHSAVVFRVKHMDVNYFYGRLNEVSGTFSIDPASPESGAIDITIKTASVDTNNKKRDDHLRSGDFFNVTQFPEITFKSKSFKKTGDNKYDVAGDLTMHGVTKSVTVPVEHVGRRDSERGAKSGIEAVFTIKRSDYGMSFMLDGLGDDIRIMAGIEGGKK